MIIGGRLIGSGAGPVVSASHYAPGFTGWHDAAVGENDLDGYEVVADQAIIGGCPAVAAAGGGGGGEAGGKTL